MVAGWVAYDASLYADVGGRVSATGGVGWGSGMSRFFHRRPRGSSPIDKRRTYGEEKRQVDWGQPHTFWMRACRDLRSVLPHPPELRGYMRTRSLRR